MYTSFGRKSAVDSIQNFLSTENIEEKFDIMREMRIHRNILIQWMQDFKTRAAGVRAKFLKKQPVDLLVKGTYAYSAGMLFCNYVDVVYWLDAGLKLRTQILEKYNRLVVNESRLLYVKISHSADLDDIVQLLAIEAMRALDRCNVEKGPLTSYLQQYLKFSGSKIDFEKDSSYVVKGISTIFVQSSFINSALKIFTEAYNSPLTNTLLSLVRLKYIVFLSLVKVGELSCVFVFIFFEKGLIFSSTPFRYVAVRAVKKLAKSVGNGKYCNIQATMPLNKRLFIWASTRYWIQYGKRFGTTKEQMQSMKIE
jgi:hypothetical protein